jgi:hypothetical protein
VNIFNGFEKTTRHKIKHILFSRLCARKTYNSKIITFQKFKLNITFEKKNLTKRLTITQKSKIQRNKTEQNLMTNCYCDVE